MESQLEGFLNLLGEAEGAGGRVLHELTEQAKSLKLREMLKKVGHDEGYYGGLAHVRRLGGILSTKTGDFVEKVRAVADFRGKLELLNRGQRWVIRKIEENIGTVGGAVSRHSCSRWRRGIGLISARSKTRWRKASSSWFGMQAWHKLSLAGAAERIHTT